MNRKLLMSIAIIILAYAAVGGATMAWFTAQSAPINNVFTAGTVKISAGEKVSDAHRLLMANWNPGDCVDKVFTITNNGTKRIVIRTDAKVSLSGQWYDADGTTLWTPPIIYDDASPAKVVQPVTITVLEKGTNVDEWTLVDDYWYYNGVIDANTGTAKMTLRVCLNGPYLKNDFQGKVFKLTTTFEAIQSSNFAPYSEWGVVLYGTP